MNASKSINIKIAIILRAKINRIMLKNSTNNIYHHKDIETICVLHKELS